MKFKVVSCLFLFIVFSDLSQASLVGRKRERSPVEDRPVVVPAMAPQDAQVDGTPSWEVGVFTNGPIVEVLFRKLDIADVFRLSGVSRTLDNALKLDVRAEDGHEVVDLRKRFFTLFAYLIARDCRKTYTNSSNPLMKLQRFMKQGTPIGSRIRVAGWRGCAHGFNTDPTCVRASCFGREVYKHLEGLLSQYTPESQARARRIVVRNLIRLFPSLHERGDHESLISVAPSEERHEAMLSRIVSEICALDLTRKVILPPELVVFPLDPVPPGELPIIQPVESDKRARVDQDHWADPFQGEADSLGLMPESPSPISDEFLTWYRCEIDARLFSEWDSIFE